MNITIAERNSKLENTTFKLFNVLLPLVFIYPILKENLSSFLLILLCTNTLFYSIATKNYKKIRGSVFLLTIPFWIVVIRSFFTTNTDESFRHIQHALFFLIIPVFFSLIPKDFFTKKKINIYITVIKNVCLLILVSYMVSFLIDVPLWKFDVIFNHGSVFRNYIYYDFKLFVIHPTYYTAILILCSAHSLEMILKEKKYYQLIYLLAFTAVTFMLLARLNVVLLCSTLFLMILFRSNFNKKLKLSLVVSILMIISLLSYITPGIKERFTELYQSFNVKPVDIKYDSTNIRMAIFDSSVAIAKENWVLGVGFENLQNKLNDTYKQNYDSSFYSDNNYMTHNYYFYIFLSSGLLGLLFYIFYVGNIIKICLKSNVFLFNVLLFSVLILCFVEDFFYRQNGILYFNLFLLCFINNNENLLEEKQTEKLNGANFS